MPHAVRGGAALAKVLTRRALEEARGAARAEGVVGRIERETMGGYFVGVELPSGTPRNKPRCSPKQAHCSTN